MGSLHENPGRQSRADDAGVVEQLSRDDLSAGSQHRQEFLVLFADAPAYNDQVGGKQRLDPA